MIVIFYSNITIIFMKQVELTSLEIKVKTFMATLTFCPVPCPIYNALSPLSVTRIRVNGHLNYTNKFPSKFAQGTMIVTSILEVPRSNLGRDTGYLD